MTKQAWLALLLVAACKREAKPASEPDANGVFEGFPPREVVAAISREACPRVVAPYFFAVEKDGKVSHILGSRHIGVDLERMPDVVRTTFDLAALAVFETPSGDLPHHKEEHDLKVELGDELWARYRGLVGPKLANRLRHRSPMLAGLAVGMLYEDLSAMLDKQLKERAAKGHIPTTGLETAAFQDELLRRWIDLKSLRASILIIDDRAEIERKTRESLSRYCGGADDTAGPTAEERADMLATGYTEADLERFQDDLIYDRNRAWIPKLDQLLAPGDVFVVVGADHLRGPKGVIALLQQDGWHVTRVTPPAPAAAP